MLRVYKSTTCVENTVEPVYKDHPRGLEKVISKDRCFFIQRCFTIVKMVDSPIVVT